MKRIVDITFIIGLLIIITSGFRKSEKPDSIYFASLNRAIQLGQYDGTVEVKELLSHGDFGLGSEEKLRSELVVLDGAAYGIKADGNASVLHEAAQIPFATVKFFGPDTTFMISDKISFKRFKKTLDSILGPNSFAAIKATGTFSHIQFRSFYKQEKPYLPIEEALFNKFETTEMEGTAVGFFTPASSEVLNSPSYHFHFIDKTKITGGHVLDLELNNVRVEIDYSRELVIKLPSHAALSDVNLSTPIHPH